MLKEPKPIERTEPLMISANDDLAVALVWIIVRDGPGTWAKNVDWDEYHLVVRNRSENPLAITSVGVADSLGHEHHPLAARGALVDGTKASKRRYEGQDIEVQAGLGSANLLVTGTVVTAGTAALLLGGGSGWMAVSAGSTAMAFAIFALPVFTVAALWRANNNRKVHAHIVERHTPLPVTLDGGSEGALVLFYPLAPAPTRITIAYSIGPDHREMTLDTTELLGGLHIVPAD